MNAAHVGAEAAITTRSGFTVDLADFAIASQPNGASEAMTELLEACQDRQRACVTTITFWSFSTSRARKEKETRAVILKISHTELCLIA
jgi:hypothetical protein